MPRTIAFFNGNTSATGSELWATDGTAAATELVADIVPGAAGSNPYNFAPAGAGAVVFTANDGGTNGPQVFASNGTAAGTAELNNGFVRVPSNLPPFGDFTKLANFTPLGNGRTLFVGATDTNSLQLWSTDSTVAGTIPVKSFAGSPGRATIGSITPLGNGKAVFGLFGPVGGASGNGLWVTDGTAAGTVQLSSGAGVTITSLGSGKAVTVVADNNGGVLLGVTDGTADGTVTAYGFAGVASVTAIGNGRALLSASDGLAGNELWVTDGTAAGTVKLVQGPVRGQNDVNGFSPVQFTPLGDGRFVFAADDGNALNALWVTDGTAAGTALLREVGPPGSTTYPISSLTALGGGKAVFKAIDLSTGNSALLVTDGTAAGTTELLRFAAVQGASALSTIAALPNGTAVFGVAVGQNAFQIWRTDGTAAGTAAIAQTTSFGQPSFTVLPDGRALFSVDNGNGTSTLWATSGMTTGTGPIGDVSAYGSFGLATVADPDPLFDSDYYYARNPDVAASGYNAAQHYLAFGGTEGRSPDPFFDGKLYLAQNPDVAASGINPLVHFEQYGWREGRDPSLLFSVSKYLGANPDVAANGIDPLEHYLRYGRAEGRAAFLSGGTETADPLVQAAFYDPQLGASLVPTGAAAAQQAAWSYNTAGWQRGLNPDPFFDTASYLAHNPDVAAAHVNPLVQYEQFGWKEGRDPSAAFSTRGYLAANPDVAAAGVDPLLHYVQYGQTEGRAIYPA